MAAIGWPRTGDLSGRDRAGIANALDVYGYESRSLGQVTGIIDRFVNQIRVGDGVAVPDGPHVFFGVVNEPYSFHEELTSDKAGYPHWVGIEYRFRSNPILRTELPAVLFDALKGRQTVFSLPADAFWGVIENPDRYDAVDIGDGDVEAKYLKKLSSGSLPGINSPSFEDAVLKVLSLYFPGLTRLGTTDAPAGADTDLKTSLPGGIVVRVQVKCYQDRHGELTSGAVTQLRDSMDPGEHGIIVTTNRAAQEAYSSAANDPLRPIGIIDGSEFAQLVFENLDKLNVEDMWKLGLRRTLEVR